MNSSKVKHAAVPIYRPPVFRSDDSLSNSSGKSKLNVHAKEFILNDDRSFQSGAHSVKDNDLRNDDYIVKMCSRIDNYPVSLMKSKPIDLLDLTKSSYTNSFNENRKLKSNSSSKLYQNYNLQKTKSSGSVLSCHRKQDNNSIDNLLMNSKVQPRVPSEKINRSFSGKNSQLRKDLVESGNLKRSKSMTSADTLQFMALKASLSVEVKPFNEYKLFPITYRRTIKRAVEDASQLDDKCKVILGKIVLEHALNNKNVILPAVNLSIIIINQDESRAYFDSLLNLCQMLYQTKMQGMLSDFGKFAAFISFILEMYNGLKRSISQAELLCNSSLSLSSSKTIFLMLLAKCCADILANSEIHSPSEIGSLYLVLTSVGRDMESELPVLFQKIFDIMREVLLKGKNTPDIQKLLLQLIELKAAKWQLPISALNYYYSK